MSAIKGIDCILKYFISSKFLDMAIKQMPKQVVSTVNATSSYSRIRSIENVLKRKHNEGVITL